MDAWFPSSFIKRSISKKSVDFQEKTTDKDDFHITAPSLLSCCRWWRLLLEKLPCMTETGKRRLLVEGGWGWTDPTSSADPRYTRSQYDDIASLARRVIFIHPAPPERNVIVDGVFHIRSPSDILVGEEEIRGHER